MKTGNTPRTGASADRCQCASMEPGHEDREYEPIHQVPDQALEASMEPGHEDREYARSMPPFAAIPGLNGARS